MGRLTKSKIDEIAKLRRQGYTQKETAEKLRVHLRTVRKYDPLHESRPGGERSPEDRLAALEEAVRTCWDFIYLLEYAMCRFGPLREELEEKTYDCPRCKGKLRFENKDATYVCRDCKLKIPASDNLCYKCLAQGEMDYDEAKLDWVCRKCGAQRYSD